MKISTRIQQQVRAANEDAMPDSVTVLERTEASDNRGGITETWTTVRTKTKGRLTFIGNKPNYQDVIRGAQMQANEAYLLSVPVGTGVEETEHLRINGETEFAIVSAIDPRSFQMAEKFLVKRV